MSNFQKELESIEQDFNENKQRLNQTIKAQKEMIFNSNSFIRLMANNTGKEVSQDSILILKRYANSWYRAELVNSSYLTIVNSDVARRKSRRGPLLRYKVRS